MTMNPLKVDSVAKLAEQIKQVDALDEAGDHEAAHGLEREITIAVLYLIGDEIVEGEEASHLAGYLVDHLENCEYPRWMG